MECNKGEALRSREIAEQRFLQHDLEGARKLALEAQSLCPELEGIPQLLAVLDVHIMAQQKGGIGASWYDILQIDATSDLATIRKQYRKLALILHPDKNKSVGAEAAFKLISEAWHVLSDRQRKADHDAKRKVRTPQTLARKTSTGFHHFATSSPSWRCSNGNDPHAVPTAACPFCKMQFQHQQTVKRSCPGCGKLFLFARVCKNAEESVVSRQSHSLENNLHMGHQRPLDTDESQRVHKRRNVVSSSGFSFLWGNHTSGIAKCKVARTTAELVQETYEMVRKERLKAHKEAHEQIKKERMEEERKARGTEQTDRALERDAEEIVREAKSVRICGDKGPQCANVYMTHLDHPTSTFECPTSAFKDADDDNAYTSLLKDSFGRTDQNAGRIESSEPQMMLHGDSKSSCSSKARYVLSSRIHAL